MIITIKINTKTAHEEQLIRDVLEQTSVPAVIRQGLYRSGLGAPKAFKKALARATLTWDFSPDYEEGDSENEILR